MAKPIIKYSESTGSDTAASGMGPATAITGTTAAHTNGAASTTIILADGPDLTGVAVDDALWIDTPAGGRHLTQILATNAADTINGAAGQSSNVADQVTIVSAAAAVRTNSYYLRKTTLGNDTRMLLTNLIQDGAFASTEELWAYVNTYDGALIVSNSLSGGAGYTTADVTVTSVDANWWHIEIRMIDYAGTGAFMSVNFFPYDSTGGTTGARSIEVWNIASVGTAGTNELVEGMDFTAANWTQGSGATVTSDTSQPPPITVDADTLKALTGTFDGAGSGLFPISSALNSVITFSAYMRKTDLAGRAQGLFEARLDVGGITEDAILRVYTDDGAVTVTSVTTGGVGYTTADATVTSFDADWWYIELRLKDYAGTATSGESKLFPRDSAGGNASDREVTWFHVICEDDNSFNKGPYPNDLEQWTPTGTATVTPNTHLAPLASERTIEVEDAFSIAVGSAVDYAIGGKRKTLTADVTNNDIDDAKAGWTYEFDSGNYPCADNGTHIFQNLPGSLADGRVTLQASSGVVTKPVLSWTGGVRLFSLIVEHIAISGLFLSNTVSVSGAAQAITASVRSSIRMTDAKIVCHGTCIFANGSSLVDIGGEYTSTILHGILLQSEFKASIINVDIHDCGQRGIFAFQPGATDRGSLTVIGSRLRNNREGIGLQSIAGSKLYASVSNTAVYGNTNNGIEMFGVWDVASGPLTLTNNIISENGGYGIDADDPLDLLTFADYNAFFSNTSGPRNNISAGDNDVALSSDPYVDAPNRDFTLNGVIGGGRDCFRTGLGYPN